MMRRWLAHSLMIFGVFVTDSLAVPTNHWAFAPVSEPLPPHVRNEEWCRTTIDRFILAKLEERGTGPASQAEPRTLIRRITFDLSGLPPAPREVDQFVQAFKVDPAGAVDQL